MKVCFVGNDNATPFSEYIPLATFLNQSGMDCFFLVSPSISPAILKKLKNEGIRYYVNTKKNAKIKSSKTTNGGRKKSSKGVAKSYFLKNLLLAFRFYRMQRALNQKVTKVLSAENPDVVVSYGDRGTKLIGGALWYARKKHIPIVDLEVAINELSFVFAHRLHRPNNKVRGVNKWIKPFFPSNYRKRKKRERAFFPWFKLLPLKWLGMYPPQPWNNGDSFATVKLLVSELQKNIMKEEGGREDHAVVVGQYSLDLLHHQYTQKEKVVDALFDKYCADQKGNEVIVVALPQLYEHGFMPLKLAVQEIEFLIKILSEDQNKTVFVSLHPKMNPNDYLFVGSFSNVFLLREERLNEVLPVADYFAAAFESTINWALLTNAVCIFIDFYRLGYNVDKYASVQKLDDKSTASESLKRIFSEKEQIRSRIKEDQLYLPPFDGKSGERIITALKKVVHE